MVALLIEASKARALVPCVLLQRAERLLQLPTGLLEPVLHRAFACCLWREIRIVRGLCEYGMHFASAPAQHPGEPFIGSERIAIPRRDGLLIHDAHEDFFGPAAAVALVGDETLHNSDRGGGALGITAANFPEEGGNARKISLCENSSHLHFGVNAGRHAAE